MATPNSETIGVGAAGKVYIGPAGDLSAAITAEGILTVPESFSEFGYISDAGVSIAENSSTQSIKSWGGKERKRIFTEYTEAVSFTPIQVDADVLKATYGEDNVTVSGGIMVAKHTDKEMPAVGIIIDWIPYEGCIARAVCPNAQLSERGEKSLTGTGIEGRQLGYTCYVDDTAGYSMAEAYFKTAWLNGDPE